MSSGPIMRRCWPMNEGRAWPLYQRGGGLYPCNSVHALNLAEQTEIARVRQPHEAAGKIRAINRGIEEESQRRYYTVHRRHQGVLALLPYLEAAQIIHGVGMIVLSACYLPRSAGCTRSAVCLPFPWPSTCSSATGAFCPGQNPAAFILSRCL